MQVEGQVDQLPDLGDEDGRTATSVVASPPEAHPSERGPLHAGAIEVAAERTSLAEAQNINIMTKRLKLDREARDLPLCTADLEGADYECDAQIGNRTLDRLRGEMATAT
jgi:hypothetical protein